MTWRMESDNHYRIWLLQHVTRSESERLSLRLQCFSLSLDYDDSCITLTKDCYRCGLLAGCMLSCKHALPLYLWQLTAS